MKATFSQDFGLLFNYDKKGHTKGETMIRLIDGCGRVVRFKEEAILREASFDEGDTSIVSGDHPNGDTFTISQHESGEWDVDKNGETVETFDEHEGKEAVDCFMNLVKYIDS